jgi:competence protein ComEA
MMQLDRKQQLVILVLVSIIIFGVGYRWAQVKERAEVENQATFEPGSAADESEAKVLLVHVTGAVEKPGVYELPEGARVIEAVNKAVPTGEANLDVLKLATKVVDEQTIYVPVKTAAVQPGAVGATNPPAEPVAPLTLMSTAGATNSAQLTGGKININTADQSQLDTLPGIGPAYAQRIIQYREINGPFKTIQDIKQVSGIGDKRFEQLKDLITVE